MEEGPAADPAGGADDPAVDPGDAADASMCSGSDSGSCCEEDVQMERLAAVLLERLADPEVCAQVLHVKDYLSSTLHRARRR
jgi:hypothetical protein